MVHPDAVAPPGEVRSRPALGRPVLHGRRRLDGRGRGDSGRCGRTPRSRGPGVPGVEPGLQRVHEDRNALQGARLARGAPRRHHGHEADQGHQKANGPQDGSDHAAPPCRPGMGPGRSSPPILAGVWPGEAAPGR
ncbi:hypothetical protein Rumeso_03630 [Rubellimicrobium mesophilum DSM 19309]|uniref:Uncharacterized protein n=1 Tax=Rubellimicrobium mesophilum DSM 19309 TaxID=442562 RepID=A0A017HKW7_9RHOB|nr:hypothetical protein Rumeso_03630 [Rubellimicrobium mesophilum DSM 19309]